MRSFIITLALIGSLCCQNTKTKGVKDSNTSTDSVNKIRYGLNIQDSISIFTTSISSDSFYSLEVKTYTEISSINGVNNKPCVNDQELIFKSRNIIIHKEKIPIRKFLTLDGKQTRFLKYVISEIAVDTIQTQKVYMLYLFASNGEPEYSFFYSQKGHRLFYQNCEKKGCSFKYFNIDEKDVIDFYSRDSGRSNMQEVKLCE